MGRKLRGLREKEAVGKINKGNEEGIAGAHCREGLYKKWVLNLECKSGKIVFSQKNNNEEAVWVDFTFESILC